MSKIELNKREFNKWPLLESLEISKEIKRNSRILKDGVS